MKGIKNLFDIPISALSNLDTSKIFSGSVTASVSPNRGFEVFAATSKFSGSISASRSSSSSSRTSTSCRCLGASPSSAMRTTRPAATRARSD
jgi:hypothetical protein